MNIDITGPKGNAIYLLNQAQILAEQLGKNFEDIEYRMQADDYENLLDVFEAEFGEYVTLSGRE